MNKLNMLVIGVVTVLAMVIELGTKVQNWSVENPDGKVSKGYCVNFMGLVKYTSGPDNAVFEIDLSKESILAINFNK
jgi:hypothetical protein